MVDIINTDAKERMQKSITVLKAEYVKIRTGRAHTSLLEHIMVPYYGSDVPINQVANVNVLDPRTLGVVPFEKPMMSTVEKSIRDSDLGLNPTNVGTVLRIPLPPMTEERRRELVKVVRHEAENAKVAVRNIRRDANHDLKTLMKDGDIPKDDEHHAEENIQKLTNDCVSKIDKILAEKETELMEI
ncbi:ribosome recycling factor [Candidatus Halobeggiatoa sp. HSG11]|nr:ribosome recycling factor [Candidatus Halobeggiatoa sp. HSG11]